MAGAPPGSGALAGSKPRAVERPFPASRRGRGGPKAPASRAVRPLEAPPCPPQLAAPRRSPMSWCTAGRRRRRTRCASPSRCERGRGWGGVLSRPFTSPPARRGHPSQCYSRASHALAPDTARPPLKRHAGPLSSRPGDPRPAPQTPQHPPPKGPHLMRRYSTLWVPPSPVTLPPMLAPSSKSWRSMNPALRAQDPISSSQWMWPKG
jgi:hypothetical protein